ncbi:MAG: SUMF1/EgtB/PvdO family nonheme iron enzyme [Pirellulaceae bacterium]
MTDGKFSVAVAAVMCLLAAPVDSCGATELSSAARIGNLRSAIEDLVDTFPDRYRVGPQYLSQLEELQCRAQANDPEVPKRLTELQHLALLDNPLLRDLQVLVVKRKWAPQGRTEPDGRYYNRLGMPSNHECNSSLDRSGWDNEIAILTRAAPQGELCTVYRPDDGGYVGELELHFDADRLMFTRSQATGWKVWEIDVTGGGLQQVSQLPDDVDCMDPLYVPDGGFIFGSTACYQSVPCWHGQRLVTNLFRMDADGSHVRRLCYDQDHDLHPTMLPSGQVLFNRWDYTGISHIYLRQLMVMNPDGTGQRAIYGSNSWYPNALYFARPLPGDPQRLVAILSGYHGPHRLGQLVLIDTRVGWQEEQGLTQRISGCGQTIEPVIKDELMADVWPRFLHPYPLSDKHFLVAGQMQASAEWCIYLADVFDNVVLLKQEPGWALLEPVPMVPRPQPQVIPQRVTLSRDDAVVYINDIHAGPGLAGVPRGTVKRLRVAAYDFGYPGLAGPDKVGYGGPWEVMRILGTVPIETDGSALFRLPANTPITLQALDDEGKAVQLMRSWYTAMPGESVSCVGCHETPRDAAAVASTGIAARGEPREIEPWYGPPRGFDFAREVQPVLDRHCVSCHDGSPAAVLDLRDEQHHPEYRGLRVSDLEIQRLHAQMYEKTGGVLRYTPAYEALLGYIRRVSIEDDVSLLTPGEYHADTSELIQLLKSGHGNVSLDAESWDRLVTWIDLNAPCHGTWSDVWPIPEGGQERRKRLRVLTGGPSIDPETEPRTTAVLAEPGNRPEPLSLPSAVTLPAVEGWPFDAQKARQMQAANGPRTKAVDLDEGATLELVRIPAGTFVLGDAQGRPDEQPLAQVRIEQEFWIGVTEISNAIYRQFDPKHDCRYYNKRHAHPDDQGLPLNAAHQPVVRVSWQEATEFCRWLSRRTGLPFSLPTEAQWEWAARAGSASSLWYGGLDTDPTPYANLAGREFGRGRFQPGLQQSGGVQHLWMDGAWLADQSFDDGAIVTQPVGGREPNAWGLFDLAGNAAEWTRSEAAAYPYVAAEDHSEPKPSGRKIVRGGSFFDRPARARSASRSSYPAWQRVFNVGFRVLCEDPLLAATPPVDPPEIADPVSMRIENLGLLPQSQPVAFVRVRNVDKVPYAGEIKLQVPDSWRLTPAAHHVELTPGEERRLAFSVEGAHESATNRYSMKVTAKNDRNLVTRSQEIVVASAPYFKPVIDGDAGDWKDAIAATFATAGRNTTISTFWNRRSFSILIAVDEDALCLPGQGEHFDAVQFSLAARDTITHQSTEGPAQRFEYLLVSHGEQSAACYQLAKPDTKLAQTVTSRALESLARPPVELVVRRTDRVTYYECSLPWDEMRQVLQPAEGREIYLSVLVHDPDGTGVRDWGTAAGLWESQRNWFGWSKWNGALWGDKPPLDSRTEWGLCSSRY